jgi:hypothetical protein
MISRLWAGVVGVSLLVTAGSVFAHEVAPAAPVALVAPAEAVAAPLILAQYSDSSQSNQRRVSGRGARSLAKLGIAGAVLLFSGAMWVVRKVMS